MDPEKQPLHIPETLRNHFFPLWKYFNQNQSQYYHRAHDLSEGLQKVLVLGSRARGLKLLEEIARLALPQDLKTHASALYGLAHEFCESKQEQYPLQKPVR